jgi:hypothetical protein
MGFRRSGLRPTECDSIRTMPTPTTAAAKPTKAKNDPERAVADFDQALKSAPSFVGAHRRRGAGASAADKRQMRAACPVRLAQLSRLGAKLG